MSRWSANQNLDFGQILLRNSGRAQNLDQNWVRRRAQNLDPIQNRALDQNLDQSRVRRLDQNLDQSRVRRRVGLDREAGPSPVRPT